MEQFVGFDWKRWVYRVGIGLGAGAHFALEMSKFGENPVLAIPVVMFAIGVCYLIEQGFYAPAQLTTTLVGWNDPQKEACTFNARRIYNLGNRFGMAPRIVEIDAQCEDDSASHTFVVARLMGIIPVVLNRTSRYPCKKPNLWLVAAGFQGRDITKEIAEASLDELK